MLRFIFISSWSDVHKSEKGDKFNARIEVAKMSGLVKKYMMEGAVK